MYKHTITYTDFDDNERQEELFFNINKKELNEMQKNGFADLLADAQKKIEAKDFENLDIYGIMSQFVLMAYGRKSEDGKRFIKDPGERYEFSDSCAFEAIVDELLAKPELTEAFVMGIIPKSLVEQVSSEYEQKKAALKTLGNA